MNIQSMTKRDQILSTTTLIIAQEGVDGGPMSQIAKRAGVAVGTIYHHFESKEEIINEIYYSIRKRVGDVIIERSQGQKDYKEEFKSVTLGMYNYYVEHPIEYTFLLQLEYSPIITAETRLNSEKFFAPIFEFYQRGMALGILIEMDLMLMGMITYNNIKTLVDLKLKGYDLSAKLVDQGIEYSWRGIAK